MRHSLLVRWLALTLTIALGSIIATAALATYGTTEQLRQQSPEAGSLVETDAAILQKLNRYAAEHDSWKGIEKAVTKLADRYDRRIALTAPDGSVLADSHRVSLPQNAVATVDAAGDMAKESARMSDGRLLSSASVYVAEFSMAGSETLQWSKDTMQKTAGCVRANYDSVEGVLVAEGKPVAVQSATMRETEPRDGAGHKIEDFGDIEDDSDGDGHPNKLHEADYATVELLDLSGDPCLPAKLKASTARTKKIDERQNTNLRRCLDRNSIEYADGPESLGAATIKLAESAPDQKVRACSQQATEQALQGFVAPPAMLYLGTSDRFDAFSADGFWRTATMAFAVLVGAALVTVLAGRRMVRPIQALTGAAQRMANGDHSARVPESGRDEVARMGAAFNQMAESVQGGERQRKAMVSDVAHELRNPLANVRGYLEAAEDGVVELDNQLVGSLQEEARLLDRLVDDLQDLALADAGELRLHLERCGLAELAGQVATGYQAQADNAGVSLSVRNVTAGDCDPFADGETAGDDGTAHDVLVDPARMRQVIGNLVSNALAYTAEGGQVVIEVRGRTVTVTDTGVGIADEHLPHLFDRFYRADPSRSRGTGGSGLGLAITNHLVQAHGGTITVASTVGQGTSFTLGLPADD